MLLSILLLAASVVAIPTDRAAEKRDDIASLFKRQGELLK